ncbi:response regulator transcription factor [Brevibacillus sp. SYP-B805]|uniref:response regulator n=1 Tax=Brevibacillus sp. SYP-B805 TaxID=1578199 RepID=UPI0013EC59EA|nr:response regulator transcription factor [Brevibacillus sp. SYP-B805]
MHILLIEDDSKLGALVQYKLSREYHTVDWVSDPELVDDYLKKSRYDLYILDWMMPRKSGLEICKELRSRNDATPILMLTARDAVPDRVLGLNSGADDYLVKPFAFEELFARIHALGRRNRLPDYHEDVYTVGGITLNTLTHEVTREGVPIALTKKEFQLLAFMMRHAGRTISREQLLDHVWGVDAAITPNAVDAAIKLLRKKVDDGFAQKLIHNVRGFGYRLSCQEENDHV